MFNTINEEGFVDFSFRELFNLEPEYIGTSCCDATGYPWCLNFISRVLLFLNSDSMLPINPDTKYLLARIESVFGSRGVCGDQSNWNRLVSLHRSNGTQLLYQLELLISETIGKIKSLNPGHMCCIPVGISVSQDLPPVFFILAIYYREKDYNLLDIGVINTSKLGYQYHKTKISEDIDAGVILRDGLLVISKVSIDKLLHSFFWIAVYRLLLTPSSSNVDTFYVIILPFLNSKPLIGNLVSIDTQNESHELMHASNSIDLNNDLWFKLPDNNKYGSTFEGALTLLYFVLKNKEKLSPLDIFYVRTMFWCGVVLLYVHNLKLLASSNKNKKFQYNGFLLPLLTWGIKKSTIIFTNQLENVDKLPSLPSSLFTSKQEFIALFTSMTEKLQLLHLTYNIPLSLPCSYWQSQMVSSFKIQLKKDNNLSNLNLPPYIATFSSYGYFRHDIKPDFESLLGESSPTPLIIPPDIHSVSRIKINSSVDVSSCLKACLDTCTLLANQEQLIQNSYILRFELIGMVILKMIPLPLRVSYPNRNKYCFWANQKLHRETQTELLRLLHSLTRHFVVASFSIQQTTYIYAKRVIIMAAICCLCDAILRSDTAEGLSCLGGHYSGQALGPIEPYAFSIHYFSNHSEFFILTDPNLSVARCMVLDYLSYWTDLVSIDHHIFNFESSMQFTLGDKQLMQQMCLQYGFPNPSSNDQLGQYFTGEEPSFIDYVPEFIYFRDIIFYFKTLFLQDPKKLPPLQRWNLASSKLKWSFNSQKSCFTVKGFNSNIESVELKSDENTKIDTETVLTKLLGLFGNTSDYTPPSSAHPTYLTDSHEVIENEDDVLCLKTLPDFGNRLPPQQSEILLQYLTVPYIRIPLVLQFFSDDTRIDLLTCSEIQNVLMASVFEPSLWQVNIKKTMLDSVPIMDKSAFSTPFGLLFNELIYNPNIFIESVTKMLDIVIEKDTGNPFTENATLVYFVTQFVGYINRFITFILNYFDLWMNQRSLDISNFLYNFGNHSSNAEELSDCNSNTFDHSTSNFDFSYCGFKAMLPRLQLPSSTVLVQLKKAKEQIDKRLNDEILLLFHDWMKKALSSSNLLTACRIYAHIIYILANVKEEEYTFQIVSHLLVSFFFIFTHFNFSLEATQYSEMKYDGQTNESTTNLKKSLLGFCDSEIFTIFQHHSHSLLKWIKLHPEEGNIIIESTVKTVSLGMSFELKSKMNFSNREWIELHCFGGFGRLVPKAEAQLAGENLKQLFETSELGKIKTSNDSTMKGKILSHINNMISSCHIHYLNPSHKLKLTDSSPSIDIYEAWLRAITSTTSETEVNLQTGELSLRRNNMEILGTWVNDFPDFINFFGKVTSTKMMQSAVVSSSKNCHWLRLVGREYDLQKWINLPSYYYSIPSSRVYSRENLSPNELWIPFVLDPWIHKYYPHTQLFIENDSKFSFCIESNIDKNNNNHNYDEVKLSLKQYFSQYNTTSAKPKSFAHLYCTISNNHSKTKTTVKDNCYDKPLVKKIVVTRFPPMIEVYNIVEKGRQFYPELCYVSSVDCSLGFLECGDPLSFLEKGMTNNYYEYIYDYFTLNETSLDNNNNSRFNYSSSDQIQNDTRDDMIYVEHHDFPRYSLSSGMDPTHYPDHHNKDTLSIFRNTSSLFGYQKYISHNHINGLLPYYLLKKYDFWNFCSQDIILGIPKKKKKNETKVSMLKINLIVLDSPRIINQFDIKYGDAYATVERLSISKDGLRKLKTEHENRRGYCFDRGTPESFSLIEENRIEHDIDDLFLLYNNPETVEVLINTKFADQSPILLKLCQTLGRIENMSNVLIWGKYIHLENSASNPLNDSQAEICQMSISIKSIEMPRLRISFITVPIQVDRLTCKSITVCHINESNKPFSSSKYCNTTDFDELNTIKIQNSVQGASTADIAFTGTKENIENGVDEETYGFLCEQHSGLYLSFFDIRSDNNLVQLIKTMYNGIILQNKDGDFFLLTDSIAKPIIIPAEAESHEYVSENKFSLISYTKNFINSKTNVLNILSSENKTPVSIDPCKDASGSFESSLIDIVTPSLLFDRNDKQWISNLKESRHYLYTIHNSHFFIFPPTLASKLYLLLIHFLTHQYQKASEMLKSVHFISTVMESEEWQLWEWIKNSNHNKYAHPDSHSTRIRLWISELHTSSIEGSVRPNVKYSIPGKSLLDSALKINTSENTKLKESSNKSVEYNIIHYLNKISYVSGKCKLTVTEEFELLRYFPFLVQLYLFLQNRFIILQQLDNAKVKDLPLNDMQLNISNLNNINFPAADSFDNQNDYSIVENNIISNYLEKMTGSLIVSKKLEEPLISTNAIQYCLKLLDTKLNLFTHWHLLYELLTEANIIEVFQGERTHLIGSLLCRFLSSWDYKNKNQLMSILRILINNPNLAKEMPHLREEKKHKLPIRLMLKSQDVFSKFFSELQFYLQTKHNRNELYWPSIESYPKEIVKSSVLNLSSNGNFFKKNILSDFDSMDTSCEKRMLMTLNFSKIQLFLNRNQHSFDNVFSTQDEDIKFLEREFPSIIASFALCPLSHHLDMHNLIQNISRTSLNASLNQKHIPDYLKNIMTNYEIISDKLPFDLDNNNLLKTPFGSNILQRLKADILHYSNQENNNMFPTLKCIPLDEILDITSSSERLACILSCLSGIQNDLIEGYHLDDKLVNIIIKILDLLCNYSLRNFDSTENNTSLDVISILRKVSNIQASVYSNNLISILICSDPHTQLQKFNPHISVDIVDDILSLIMVLLFLISRKTQLNQADIACKSLYKCVKDIQQSLTENKNTNDILSKHYVHLISSCNNLCRILTRRRHYIETVFHDSNKDPESLHFDELKQNIRSLSLDPRMLVFEFAYNIMLRKEQITLTNVFLDHIRRQKSLCHQAVMGLGKTTVISPLLALLLLNSKGFIIQIVPPALLEFTQSIMQERLSSIINKNVMLFSFSRGQSITSSLFSSFIHAKEKKALILASPSSVKSLFLKVVYLFSRQIEKRNYLSTYIGSESIHYLNQIRDAFGKLLKTSSIGASNLEFKISSSDDSYGSNIKELDLGLHIIDIFRNSIALLDEVDTLLHPFKSELHWPIGPKYNLDLADSFFSSFPKPYNDMNANKSEDGKHVTSVENVEEGLRWKIPWHLLDAFFSYDPAHDIKKLSVPFASSKEAVNILNKFHVEIQNGISLKAFQTSPHLILLDETYYHSKLKHYLASWLYIRLKKSVKFKDLDASQIQHLLCLPINEQLDNNVLIHNLFLSFQSKLSATEIKIINLSREWLNNYLPFVLRKINRVGYGIMSLTELNEAKTLNKNCSVTRQLLAVPFIGKDTPSEASEYAHPDIVIGLTILAYRYDGLRYNDFLNIIEYQLDCLSQENQSLAFRPSLLEYSSWIEIAGGVLRGKNRFKKQLIHCDRYLKSKKRDYIYTTAQNKYGSNLDNIIDNPSAENYFDVLNPRWKPPKSSFSTNESVDLMKCMDSNVIIEDDKISFKRIWPLNLINPVKEKDHCNIIYRLLWKEPLVIQSFLFHIVFPMTLKYSCIQLSSSGQELGGSNLFKIRLGFSGTPNELLPLEMGNPMFQKGTYGQILHLLTQPKVVSIQILPSNWTVDSILDIVASQVNTHALIDSGALITGKSNYVVAYLLLSKGLSRMQGVVFFDERDRKKILVRNGWRIMKLAQCGISPEFRFTFYDQVHTLGQDVSHIPTAHALLTLSKDMVFRDLAQGAWRMRGIGSGQTICLLIPPEVTDLISKQTLSLKKNMANTVSIFTMNFDSVEEEQSINSDKNITSHNPLKIPYRFLSDGLSEVTAWLVVSDIESEFVQFKLLCEQNLMNVFRKNAFRHLCESRNSREEPGKANIYKESIKLLESRLDYTISTDLFTTSCFLTHLNNLIEQYSGFIESKEDSDQVKWILDQAKQQTEEYKEATFSSTSNNLYSEIIQEQEVYQELEECDENEKEQEQENIKELEKEIKDDTNSKSQVKTHKKSKKYHTWHISLLKSTEIHDLNSEERKKFSLLFSKLCDLKLFFKIASNKTNLSFPETIWVSSNFCDSQLSSKTIKLKHALVVLEWIPNFDTNTTFTANSQSKPKSRYEYNRIEAVFNIMKDYNHRGLDRKNLCELLLILRLKNDCINDVDGLNKVANSIFDICMLIRQNHNRNEVISSNQKRNQANECKLNFDSQQKVDSFANCNDLRGIKNETYPNQLEKDQKKIDTQGYGSPKENPLYVSSDLLGIQKQDSTSPLTISSTPSTSWSYWNDDLATESDTLHGSECLITLNELYEALHTMNYLNNFHFNLPKRYYAILSLPEAQSLRAILHASFENQSASILPNSHLAIALRHIGSDFGLIDASPFFLESPQNQIATRGIEQQIVNSCCRFFNAELYYSEYQIRNLLYYLNGSDIEQRKQFFETLYQLRKRKSSNETCVHYSDSLKKILDSENDIKYLIFSAIKSKVSQQFLLRDLSPLDAFSLFDINHKGYLNIYQLYAGLKYLNIHINVQEFLDIWKNIPLNQEDCLEKNDFAALFDHSIVHENESYELYNSYVEWLKCWRYQYNDSNATTFHYILSTLTEKELEALKTGISIKSKHSIPTMISPMIWQSFKFRITYHSTFKKIWIGILQGESVQADKLVSYQDNKRETCIIDIPLKSQDDIFSIWKPESLDSKYRSLTRRNRQRICLGYFICPGNSLTKSITKKSIPLPMVLEIEDCKVSTISESSDLKKAINFFFPYPVGFDFILEILSIDESADKNKNHLYLWKPISCDPNVYTFIGLCATTTRSPPNLDVIRSIPIKWMNQYNDANKVNNRIHPASTKIDSKSFFRLVGIHPRLNQLSLKSYPWYDFKHEQFTLFSTNISSKKKKKINIMTSNHSIDILNISCPLNEELNSGTESNSTDLQDQIPNVISKEHGKISSMWF